MPETMTYCYWFDFVCLTNPKPPATYNSFSRNKCKLEEAKRINRKVDIGKVNKGRIDKVRMRRGRNETSNEQT